ncbi:putative phage-related protein [Magnetospirillum sp. XM-1]|uniref:hypothetical protein n=1 Tax=Magnetospirillum sp. XM-1 TaxID=1663591 RepID=UPI00073DFC12|nr:hypothetical protein [Magnetospirillum sp. XM-1]CUW39682.1 putative phage-related protein [Magnetospirillum sp. XM-1]
MATIPTREPDKLVAGDTWRWRRDDLADYPAGGGWTLSYVLINASGKITFSAGADGDAFLVDVAAATTANKTAGTYGWEAFVTKGSDRFRVGTGRVEVLPNFETTATADTRSHARRTLEAIDAVIEKRASKDQMSYQIDGRRLDRTPLPDLIRLRSYYVSQVRREDDAAAVAAGRGGRMVLTRFGGRG